MNPFKAAGATDLPRFPLRLALDVVAGEALWFGTLALLLEAFVDVLLTLVELAPLLTSLFELVALWPV